MPFSLMQGIWAALLTIGIMESEVLDVDLVLYAHAH